MATGSISGRALLSYCHPLSVSDHHVVALGGIVKADAFVWVLVQSLCLPCRAITTCWV